VSPQDAPTTAKRHTTEPARAAVRVRITTEAVTPSACTPRACASLTGNSSTGAPRHVVSPSPLIRSSEPPGSTSPPTRPAPRIRASSPFPNHAASWFRSRRVGASSNPVAADTSRSPRSPSKPSHVRNPRPVPGHPHHGVATVKLHDICRNPGPVVHCAGEPLQRAARPRERRSARSCLAKTRRCCHRRDPPDAEDPRTPGDQHHLARANRMRYVPPAPAPYLPVTQDTPATPRQRNRQPKPLELPDVTSRRHLAVASEATRAPRETLVHDNQPHAGVARPETCPNRPAWRAPAAEAAGACRLGARTGCSRSPRSTPGGCEQPSSASRDAAESGCLVTTA
jgi:hypothetical protein